MKTYQEFAFSSIILLLLITSCSKKGSKENNIAAESLDTLMNEYFDAKYRYLVTSVGIKSSRDQATQFFTAKESADEAMSRFDTLKSALSQGTLNYLNSKTYASIVDSTLQQHGDSAVFVVKVQSEYVTDLKSDLTGDTITIESIEYYKMTVISSNDELKIVSETPLDNSSTGAGKVEPKQTFSILAVPALTYQYSPAVAVKWAINHWNNPPSSGYYDYTSFGGDCTNFISHCLKAGGWVQNNDWFWKSNGGSGNDMTRYERSPSWTGANPFFIYANSVNGKRRLSATFQRVLVPAVWTEVGFSRIKAVSVGDVVQIATKDASPVAVHTMIVSEKLTRAPYVLLTYRNAECELCRADKNRPIDQLNAGSYLYGFGVKTSGD